ncbi:MAG: Signal Transduction Histidine Kinase with CheB and CheR [Pedosphaera sp.]|nr:Signal Transduction Histidine Kinase with CheB and CheR [Pedosphaera sp.]
MKFRLRRDAAGGRSQSLEILIRLRENTMAKKPISKLPENKPTNESKRAATRPRDAAAPQPTDMHPEEGAETRAFSIVGIGASAGGYEAFVQLLGHLPPNTGMAFVLVQHLDPKHESKLAELLARSTHLPLQEATPGLLPEPDHIYVMPPNVNMSIHDGRLRFQPRRSNGPHMPVDFFFRSLAEDRENRAIGIVLSGTGGDGTFGLQAIKGAGGITFAQDEKTAKYFGMPGSAIAAGCVDLVLPPEAMVKELERMAGHPYVRRPGIAKPTGAQAEPTETEVLFQDGDTELSAIFSMLRARTGVDFSLYKHSTLRRRILRRMLLHKINTLPSYINYLRIHLVEVDALFNDLLINVTGFFRDPQVFQVLKRRIFPKLLRDRANDNPIRVWVCGCSTGEEAYSMAISLVETFEASHVHVNAQIFATDISELALEKARAGVYPENISLDVSPERLRRFFVRTNGHYQVSKSIRDMCVFARQNVIVDPPFSNLDLISCRNMLIYLGAVLQKKIMPVFHYALKPDGFLLLGSSEAIGSASELFTLLEKKQKVYKKKMLAQRPGFTGLLRGLPEKAEIPRESGAVPFKSEPKTPDLQQYVDRLILSKWSPAAVVINAQMDVLLFRGRTGKFLEHAAGSASLQLLKMARESLSLDLRSVVSKAIKQDAPVRQENAALRHGDQVQNVTLEAIPFRLTPSSERFFLVLFGEPLSPPSEPGPARPGSQANQLRQRSDQRELGNLRSELASNKESLQAIIEEQEATNEELKSANEEIQSSNEELQSTNEELETAKEELQSTNEELTTLNEELQTRNGELSQVNNDLTNLLASVNVAIIMLSNDLTVRRFTPMAERIFNLIPSDIGRRLSDLNRNIVVPDLDDSIRDVVDNLTSIEREVQDRDGRWYSLRIRPYRTRENKIDGAVILLLDIDEHKRVVELVMSAIKQPLLALQADLRVKRANPAFYKTFQVSPEETENHYIYDLGRGQWNVPRLRTLLEDILAKQNQVDDFEVDAEFPKLGRRTMRLDGRSYSEDGRGNRLILLTIKDMTPAE